MSYPVNMAVADFPIVNFINSYKTSVGYDLPSLLELLVFRPITYVSVCVLTLAIANMVAFRVADIFKGTQTSRPTLHFKESDFSQFLLRKIPRLSLNYETPRWCLHPDVQFFVSRMFVDTKRGVVKFQRQFFQLTDRGLVALDWALPATTICNLNNCVWNNSKKSKTVLLILPNFNESAVSLG